MLYQNVNGLRSKLTSLKTSLPLCPYDNIVYSETNLNSSIRDEELGLNNYNVYRRDRDLAQSQAVVVF